MVSHDWNTYAQVCSEAELYSTFKNIWRFLKQVLRWTRNTWRSDFRSLFMERYIWRRHPFVAFTMVDKLFNPLTLLAGPILVGVFASLQESRAGPTNPPLPAWNITVSYITWLLLTRFIKLCPHFFKRPQDIWALPAWLIFNYYFAIMKIYALFTLHEVGWGTRAGIGNELAANIKEEPSESNVYETKIEMTEIAENEPSPHPSHTPSGTDPFLTEEESLTNIHPLPPPPPPPQHVTSPPVL